MSIRSPLLLIMLLCLTSCLGMGSRVPAPIVHHGQKSGAGSAGIHNVVLGDTLYSISNSYRLPMRDIIVLNRLQPPFILYEGQRLRLPPPQEYKVRVGDTLYHISRLFGVDSSEIARLNNIKSPYIVRAGQVLRLPSVTRKTRQVKNKTVTAKSSVVEKGEALASKSADADAPIVPQAKPQPAIIKDGVPMPQNKPRYKKSKNVKISKVTRKPPKRASSKFLRPVRGKVLSRYGAKKSGLHNDGINISAPRGTSVKAAENGVVVYAGNALKGSGNLVLVRHAGQWMTAYGHLDSMSVRKGQVLKRGASLGKIGSTGSVSTPQLHFEVRRGTSALNPSKYMEK
ncbi:MAG: peptidoglycan-binding protein [Alphaproteobacteria bacterium]|nr:MAG: peptidoglycan-binding protein [Alphaproteobacteria bacterium]